MSLIGTRLGAYEILARIGAGRMGEVYRARDARLGRDVARRTRRVTRGFFPTAITFCTWHEAADRSRAVSTSARSTDQRHGSSQRRLFNVGKRGGGGGSSRNEPASDGRRFLVRQVLDPPPQPVRVMLNWPAALKK